MSEPPPSTAASPAPPGPPTAPAPDRPAALFGAVRATAGVTLASRFGGLARDVLIGRVFGDTVINSAFQAAFQIPNLFRRLFGEGALSAAFLPQYTQARRADGPGEADRLASLTMLGLAAVTAAITLVLELGLFAALALASHSDERRLLIQLVMVMLPFMPLICMVAILAAMLQVHGRFAAAASGPLILNGFIIAAGLYAVLTGWTGNARFAFILGGVTVLSAVTQLAWFAWLLRRDVRWTRDVSAARARAGAMLRKFVPVAVGLGTLQLNTLFDTAVATFPIWFRTADKGILFPLDDKSNGLLALTSRLYQFPLGVFGIAVATAAFPLLARHADDRHRFTDTLRRGLRLSLFIGLPASIGLVLVRHDAVAVLYGYGKNAFTPDGLSRSAAVLLGFAPAVWAYSLNHVLTRAFYARGDTLTPMRLSMFSLGMNIVLTLSLIWTLREAGMAWSTSLAAMIQCVVLTLLARRRLCDGPLLDAPTRRSFARIIAASLVMGAAVWGVRRFGLSWLPANWLGRVVGLLLVCGVGAVVYAGVSRALGVVELRWLLSRRAGDDEPPQARPT